MKYNKTLALIPALLLAACGGDEQTMNEKVSPGSVVYSYPADGQAGVSPKADIILRFSHAVTDEDADLQNKIQVQSQGQPLPFSIRRVDGGQSLTLSPSSELKKLGSYTLRFSEPLIAEGGRQINTPNAVGDAGIQFETRGSISGPASTTNSTEAFGVAWQVPANNSPFEAMNFSTFRLAMTHPVHPDWKALGGSIQLLDGNGESVPATVLIKGNRITVDPCMVEDTRECGSKDDVLDTSQTYTLRLENLASLTSPQASRFSEDIAFTPRETGPTVVLQQSAVDSGLAAGTSQEEVTRSVLNGQIINGVTLNSVLQGEAGPSQQTGDLFAELAYAPAFDADEALPLRIARGSVLNSTSLDVLVGGEVPVLDAATGQLQTTGNIKVTMLSDASGYLSPNPYTDDLNAPRHITLFMDVSMNTENAQPNAALSQDLMGVELRGIALVQDGVLTIDAIGMVEPNLLGQEYTSSTIAFHLQAATDADSALDAELLRELDSTAPSLVSWMPGPDNAIPDTRQSMQRPGDPVILFFDEPLAPDSVNGGITLFADNQEVADIRTQLDGTTLAVQPDGGLKHGVEYLLQIDGLADISGNEAMVESLAFSLPEIDDGSGTVPEQSPIALTTYPGYPCVTQDLDLTNDLHGFCKDAAGENLPKDKDGNAQSRDILPVTTLPADRPIVVVFSQSMDLTSIRHNETFFVERVSETGTVESVIKGRLEKNHQRIRFYPDSPWAPGELYRYRMISAVNGNCQEVICGENGMALQTDLLFDPEDNGGEPLEIYFRGQQSIASVFTPLRNLPIRDANSNYYIDGFETFEFTNATDDSGQTQEYFETPPNAARLAMNGNAIVLGNDGNDEANARVGCSYEEPEECWDKKYIYQTYGLNTEVIGPEKDPETGEDTGNIRVLLYPTMLVTTPAKVWYNLLGPSESDTGPQILRMRYQEPTAGNPQGLIEGRIVTSADGGPRFEVNADLLLDAPNLHLPIEGLLAHNLFSYPFTLELGGAITFFDDGRMQIEQRNANTPLITVDVAGSSDATSGLLGFVSCLGSIFTGGGFGACEELANGTGKAVQLPLKIPPEGVYLNFISNPVKEIPAEQ
ncbi:Ig-like domain-containing protein [Marinobacter sp. es.048]|uniref:Ig-like domain-containing protein n=1 Tax=Marinobacter sp. es.048 TaxID=1761795 RepID=UPI000B59409C|nr:Ig-like domain-containing protein [Marinobacter sp. es.048]SNC76982.1 Ig-like domain-containing protein [Marinobacter sp. es.048]